MEELVGHYLEAGRGLVVALRGDYGSGKTQLIYDTILRAAGPESASLESPPPFQIYVNVEGPDFLALHRRVLLPVSPWTLRDLSRRFLGAVGVHAAFPGTRGADRRRALEEELRADPFRIYEEFRTYRIGAADAYDRQAAEVQAVTGGGADFARALSFALDSELGVSAQRWLSGQDVWPEDIRKLGVSGPISWPEAARYAIQLLVTLFGRTGRPLILYLDQAERLVLHDDAPGNGQNAGLLQSLAEFVSRAGAMLVVATSHQGWDAFGPSLQQRLTPNVLDVGRLEPKHARALARLYLEASDVSIDDAAADDLLDRADGNARRFLELCRKVFDERASDMITAEAVETVLGRDPEAAEALPGPNQRGHPWLPRVLKPEAGADGQHLDHSEEIARRVHEGPDKASKWRHGR
jgi:hypothetical protein